MGLKRPAEAGGVVERRNAVVLLRDGLDPRQLQRDVERRRALSDVELQPPAARGALARVASPCAPPTANEMFAALTAPAPNDRPKVVLENAVPSPTAMDALADVGPAATRIAYGESMA